MDNFEHVLEGADLVADILSHAPDVKILVTSREVLNLSMEHVWQLRGMRYPDSDEPEDINQYDALNLFVERAMQIRQDFSLGDEQIAIIQICQLVDGLPLAIELAAGWLKTLSCRDIIQQIEQGIDFLATCNRDIAPRHRSIRAVFDHSWNLLSADEQAVFPRLSVFHGGFTFEAAVSVTEADLMTLSGLVEKSMVRRDANGRFDIHELLRQYAEEKLRLAGETNDILDAHVNYFASFMREQTIDIKGRDQPDGLDRIQADFDNVVDAWYQASYKTHYDALDGILDGLLIFSDIRAMQHTGFSLVQKSLDILEHDNQSTVHPVLNRLRMMRIYMYTRLNVMPDNIVQLLEACYEIAQQMSDKLTVMKYFWLKGEILKQEYKKDSAIEYLTQARELARALGEPYFEVQILGAMSYLYNQYGDDNEILHAYGTIAKANGNIHDYGLSYGFRGFYERSKFNLEAAEQYIQIAIKYFRIVKDSRIIGAITFFRGYLMVLRGNFDLGESYLIEGQQATTQMNFPWNHTKLFTVRMIINIVQNKMDEAYHHKQLATEYLNRSSPDGIALYHLGQAMYEICIYHYEPAIPHLIQALSLDMPFTQHIKASAVILQAFLYVEGGRFIEATELLGLACDQLAHYTLWFKDWAQLQQLQSNLKFQLGTEDYQQAWERGAQCNFEETLAELLSGYYPDSASSSADLNPQPLIESLTSRELEVLALLGEGLSNREIATQLIISVGTVKSHVYNICQKLHAKNRTQAVLEAKKLGLL